jgi:hypothetical protein
MRHICLATLLLILPASAHAAVYQFVSLASLDADPLEISIVSDNPDRIDVSGDLFDDRLANFSSGPSGFDSLEVNSRLFVSLTPAGFGPSSTTSITFLMNSEQFRLHSSPTDFEIIGFSTAGFHSLWTFQFLEGAVGNPIVDTSRFTVGRFVAVPVSEPIGLALVGMAFCGWRSRKNCV